MSKGSTVPTDFDTLIKMIRLSVQEEPLMTTLLFRICARAYQLGHGNFE